MLSHPVEKHQMSISRCDTFLFLVWWWFAVKDNKPLLAIAMGVLAMTSHERKIRPKSPETGLLLQQLAHTNHYNGVKIGAMASQITGLPIVYLTVYSGGDQRKDQSSASLAFVWVIHRWPVNSPHKWPVTRKIFPFDESSWVKNIKPTDFHSMTLSCVTFVLMI